MWTFEISSKGEPEDNEDREQANENDTCVIHRSGGCGNAWRKANHGAEDHNPKTRKGVTEISEPTKVKISRGKLFSALEQSNSLRDGVGNVKV